MYEIPRMNEWPTKKLKDIAVDIFQGKGLTVKEMLNGGDWPCIRNQDLNKLHVHFINCISKVNPADLENSIVFVEHGTILMSDMGTEKGLGKACAYMGKESPIIGNSVVAIKHNENPIFLAHALNSPSVREQVTRKMKGTIVQHLRAQDLKNLEVPLPDLETQNKVAAEIEVMEQNMIEATGCFESYRQLYENALRKIFT